MALLIWYATYVVHSTLAYGAVLVVRRWVRDERASEMLWRTASMVPVLTATVACAAPALHQFAVPASLRRALDVADQPGALDSSDGVAWLACVLLLAGVGYFLLALASRARFLRSLRRRPLEHGSPILKEFEALSRRFGLGTIAVTMSPSLRSAIAIGTGEISIPYAALTALDPGEQQAMLAHELAHIRRRDERWAFLHLMLQRVFFVQPLHRVAWRELDHLAETACDAAAAECVGDPAVMASCLLHVAAWQLRVPAVVGIAGRGRVADRIRRLIADAQPAPRVPRARLVVVGAAAGVILAILPTVSVPSRETREYWIGFELGQRYREGRSLPADAEGWSRKAAELAAIERRAQAQARNGR